MSLRMLERDMRVTVSHWQRSAQLLTRRTMNAFALRAQDYVVAAWHRTRNWGDALNAFLIEKLSEKRVVHVSDVFRFQRKPFVYSVVGSILGDYSLPNLVVWGSGFIAPTRMFSVKPVAIRAVRGPLTRMRILEIGLTCPEIYGDPALLLPRFLKPSRTKPKYKLGIIPHFADQNIPCVTRFRNDEDILLIDICAGIEPVVEQILQCEMIASSSLHGIICADAFGIPSVWLEFSDNVLGGGFKFQDYFQSVGRKVRAPLVVSSRTSVSEILDRREDYTLEIDLDALLEACPFRA